MNLALFTLLFSMLLSSLGTSIINIALPALMSRFQTTLPDAQWASLIYLIANTLFVTVFGKLGSRYSIKKLFLLGLIVFSAASAAAVYASDIFTLSVFRFIQGMGAAALVAFSPVLLSQLAKAEQLPQYMGLIGTMSAVGTAMGPSLGGFLIEHFGWASVFWCMALFGLINFISFYLIKFENEPKQQEQKSSQSSATFGSLLKNKIIYPQLVLNFLVSMTVVSTLVVGPFFLSGALHLGFSAVGLVMSVSPLTSILSGLASGTVVKAAGPLKSILLGLLTMVFGSLAYIFLPNHLGAPGFILSAFLMSPGYQLFQTSNNTILMTQTAPAEKSMVSSLISLTRNLGLLSGSFIAGQIFVLGAGVPELSNASAQQITSGAKWAFAFALMTAAAALTFAFKFFMSELLGRNTFRKTV